MTKLSPAQQRILTDAAKNPANCITECMTDIKNPMIKQRSLDSMLTKGLINKRFTDNGKEIYLLAAPDIAAASITAQREAMTAEKPKRETKQSTIISLLGREEGVTLAELMKATEWQSHSVRGHLSNMRRKQKANIETTTNSEGNRVYRIAKDA